MLMNLMIAKVISLQLHDLHDQTETHHHQFIENAHAKPRSIGEENKYHRKRTTVAIT